MEDLLRQILAELQSRKLGFSDVAGRMMVYCNRTNNCLWYTVRDGEHQPIAHTALTGYMESLAFPRIERRGKEVVKLHVGIRADRLYVLESGHDSHFAKGLLMAIASMTPEQLRQPVTVSPQPGDDDSVLFCRVYQCDALVKAPYSEETDWRTVASTAMKNLNQALGAN